MAQLPQGADFVFGAYDKPRHTWEWQSPSILSRWDFPASISTTLRNSSYPGPQLLHHVRSWSRFGDHLAKCCSFVPKDTKGCSKRCSWTIMEAEFVTQIINSVVWGRVLLVSVAWNFEYDCAIDPKTKVEDPKKTKTFHGIQEIPSCPIWGTSPTFAIYGIPPSNKSSMRK